MTSELQEIFNRVKKGLLKQNEQCVNVNGCVYRNSAGLKCAVGQLITDEAYCSDLEEHSIEDENVKDALMKSGINVTQEVTHLLNSLQGMHDNLAPEHWKKRLDVIAKRFGLNP